ncbi:winged helix-turn-helix domain-containing protein [Qipengyuania flava]|uniref:winged helix-turn-helix domain-containing protein n=1 Tax=Qipengyuania flava TaxID=192812 RepID=UPI001C62AEC7|nr:winged helix-turn-helix domain-containing protein [Qipengyuania flava]QYJ07456.1 winged helix-turn-helix domain-containing protein [Qipengyuania flava]
MYRVAEFTIDPHRFELARNGERVEIQPRAFKLLLRLVEARGGLVNKDELYASVWDGRIVSESALSSQVKLLRKVLGDTARPHRIVETVHGQGLRIAAEIRREGASVAAEDPAPDAPAAAADGRPTIAVLPLLALNPSKAYAALPEAVPDEIITTLSKLRWLRVSARGSSFRYRSFNQEPSAIGAALGVAYCLSGSVEHAGKQVRLAFELADTRTDSVVWREAYSVALEGLFELRQEVVEQLAARIEEEVTRREFDRLRSETETVFHPWHAFHLGIGKIMTHAAPDYSGAERLFQKALAGDGHFARAHAGMAQVHYWALFQKQAADERATAMALQQAAARAMELDRHDPFCQLMAGRSHLILHQIDEGLEHLERAKALAPSYAVAYSGIGSIQALLGKGDEGLANLQMAMTLSPQDPWKPQMLGALIAAHIARDDLTSAAATARELRRYPVISLQTTAGLMATFALAGEMEEAEERKRVFLEHFPKVGVEEYLKSYPILSDGLQRLTREGFAKMELA